MCCGRCLIGCGMRTPCGAGCARHRPRCDLARWADVTLTVTAEDGRRIELDARRVRDPAVLLREVEHLLRTEDPEQ